MNSDSWENDLDKYAPHLSTTFRAFRTQVLECFRHYHVPVIELDRNTPLEAICTIFEKVNTGGVSLTVFELLTAVYAAESYNLRRDWKCRKKLIEKNPLLTDIQSTNFLKGISLLHTHDPFLKAEPNEGKTRPVSAKGPDLLKIPLQSWRHWAPRLTDTGFPNAASFLQERCFLRRKDVPYASQLVPLAAVLTRLEDKWREWCVLEKIEQWFWCGVLGELYGGSVDTRMANDFEELLGWIKNEEALPRTVTEANFQSERLETLRTRVSAAYKGVISLVLKSGALDWFWKASVCDLNASETKLDIHHIFPVAWCRKQGIPRSQYQSILNKTSISYRANRIIGGKAPSDYIPRLQDKIGLSGAEMDDILKTHSLDPDLLRRDEFTAFFRDRSARLCRLIEGAMGKRVGEALEA